MGENQTPLQRTSDRIAQWASDTGPILERFHLELLDVTVDWNGGGERDEFVHHISFLDGRMERLMTMTMATTALGTQLFGGFGGGAGKDKTALDRAKKNADAVSAYTMSESLWFASRHLPENHAIMVSLGEGLMAKGGGGVELGSNPLLGFGRIYARDRVASWLEQRVVRLINDPDYAFADFYTEVSRAHITVWGAAIDTLENTSRFAKGAETGPMTVLHLFDQPLSVSRPYEGYMGNLIVPGAVVDQAAEMSVLLDVCTPRRLVMDVILQTYPGIAPANVHVWTLRGGSRAGRIGDVWEDWERVGAHLVDESFELPSGISVFTESGTYAPTYRVGSWSDESGELHLFLCDGYAATAESMQAASLSSVCDVDVSMALLTPQFAFPLTREREVMRFDPGDGGFADALNQLAGAELSMDRVEQYRQVVEEARGAEMPVGRRVIRADDFFPEKSWETAAFVGYMRDDPYTGTAGVTQVVPDVYRVNVGLSTPRGHNTYTFTLRLTQKHNEARLVYQPLLMRFLGGEDYRLRTVKTFDSGRIRNELQTLCAEALEFVGENGMRLHIARISPDAIPPERQKILLEVLESFKSNHPLWFDWLEIVPASKA